jgi:hypothetical protein
MKKEIRPGFFSIEFHTRFFPVLLWRRLRPRKRDGVSFVATESYIAFAICLVLAMAGIPRAVTHRSFIGWVVGGAGLLGVLALFISSICSRREPPSYDGFLRGIFFFLVTLGITAGLFTGALEHSLCLGLLGSAAGLVLGYVLGIFAGLWFQYLGPLAVVLDMLAGLGIVGLMVVDLVLLLG